MKKNRYEKAYKSLLRLRHHEIQAARDLYYIHCQLQIEASIVGKSNYFSRFAQLFTIPRVRRATLASFVVMIAQQMVSLAISTTRNDLILTDAVRHKHHWYVGGSIRLPWQRARLTLNSILQFHGLQTGRRQRA